MGPVVAVEVAPLPEQGSKGLATLLEACSQALPQGSCQSASSEESAGASAIARVDWQGASALIKVRLDESESWLDRGMYFEPADNTLERWRTVGLTIATMVDELREREAEKATTSVEPSAVPPPAPPPPPAPAQASAPPPPRAPAPPPAARTTPPTQTEGRRFISLEAGAVLATAFAAGSSRVGPYLRLSPDIPGTPTFVDVSVSYTLPTSPGEPVLSWFEVSVGGGAHLTVEHFRFELEIAGVLERTGARATDPDTGREDSDGRWIPGVGSSVRLTWPASAPLAGVVGLNGSWLARELVITNAGEEVRRLPPYTCGGVVGLRVSWAE